MPQKNRAHFVLTGLRSAMHPSSPVDLAALSASCTSSASPRQFAASSHAGRHVNPLRRIVEGLRPPEGHKARPLSLTLGDPAAYGAFVPPQVLRRAIVQAASAPSPTADGYAHSAGTHAAREAVASWMACSRPFGAPALNGKDVLLASGCSGALELALAVLADEGDVILLPRPGAYCGFFCRCCCCCSCCFCLLDSCRQ